MSSPLSSFSLSGIAWDAPLSAVFVLGWSVFAFFLLFFSLFEVLEVTSSAIERGVILSLLVFGDRSFFFVFFCERTLNIESSRPPLSVFESFFAFLFFSSFFFFESFFFLSSFFFFYFFFLLDSAFYASFFYYHFLKNLIIRTFASFRRLIT